MTEIREGRDIGAFKDSLDMGLASAWGFRQRPEDGEQPGRKPGWERTWDSRRWGTKPRIDRQPADAGDDRGPETAGDSRLGTAGSGHMMRALDGTDDSTIHFVFAGDILLSTCVGRL